MKFDKLMDKKKKDKPMSDVQKDAKMSVVEDLRDMASKAMKDGLKGGVKKVSVASDSAEGLSKGLEMAKKIADSKKLGSMDEMKEDGNELDNAEEELPNSPVEGEENLESSEEEASESPEHEEAEGEDMSEEEIDAKLAKLMDMKKKIQKA